MNKLLSFCLFLFFWFQPSQAQNALQFDETIPNYVEVGNTMNTVLTGTNQITVEAWGYLTSYAFLPTLVGNYGTGMQFLLRVDANRPAFWVDNGTGFNRAHGATTVPLNTWTHLAGVWDGSQLRVYINGVLDGTTTLSTGAFNATTNPVRIGASLLTESWDGSLDEIRIWNVARTGVEIASYMNSCMNGTAANLLALYDLEEGGGSTVTDRAGNGYNGTLVNAPVWSTGIACTTLPVNFLGIHAEYNNNQVRINWKVAGELDIEKYIIERSADGISFSQIGMVSANRGEEYTFRDDNPLATNACYRVRSLEFSGVFKYSPTVRIWLASSKSTISLFPNPAISSQVNLQLINKPVGRYEVKVFDMLGRLRRNQIIQQVGSNGVFVIALPQGLPPGVYQLVLTDDVKSSEVQRFYYQP